MNHIGPPPEHAIRDTPLCQLALAPENVRKTPPDEAADAQLIASIKSHGLLEKRMLTEERVPAGWPMARFVGLNTHRPGALYEAYPPGEAKAL